MQHQEIKEVFILTDKKTKEIIEARSSMLRAEELATKLLEDSFDFPEGITITVVPLDKDS